MKLIIEVEGGDEDIEAIRIQCVGAVEEVVEEATDNSTIDAPVAVSWDTED